MHSGLLPMHIDRVAWWSCCCHARHTCQHCACHTTTLTPAYSYVIDLGLAYRIKPYVLLYFQNGAADHLCLLGTGRWHVVDRGPVLASVSLEVQELQT